MNLLTGMNWLRALAALFVVIYHLNQHLPTSGFGYFGWGIHQFIWHLSIMVSVFFMLSWFFRSLSYWKNIDTPSSIPSFYISLKDRFFRIAPAYYVMLILSALATYYISGISGINFPAFFTGFTFLTWLSPDTLFPVLLNGPLWFIPLDMIGWIMTSFFMMGLLKLKQIYYIPYFIGISILMLGLHFLWIWLPWTPGEGISFIWFPVYNPFIFFLHFLFGIAAAGMVTWLRRKNQESKIYFDIGYILTSIIGIITLWIIRDQSDWAISIPNSPYHFPWIPFLIAITMICLPFSKYVGAMLDNQFFLFTAKLSYSIFLTHGVVMAFLLHYIFPWELSMISWIILSLSTIILSYITGWILYKYVELIFVPVKKINNK